MPKNTFGQDVSKYGGSIVPTAAPVTITPESMTGPTTPAQLPSYPTANTGVSDNAATPYAQSSTDIINSNSAPTSTENAAQDQLFQLADILKGSKSLDALKAEKASTQEVTTAASNVNDITAQIEGLTNEMLALQNEANYTIPNTMDNAAEGRGITTAGLAPHTASELRKNQIKQGIVSTKALTLKSALFAAQGKYTLAKDAADRAATLAFDDQERQINYRKAVLDALQPQLTRDQQARAAKIQAALDDRTTKMNWQREDFKIGQPLIANAMALFPNDQQAQFAAQQAMKISPTDPNYLTKVMSLIGNYQQDPLDVKQKLLDYKVQQANLNKINAEVRKIAIENDFNAPTITNPAVGSYQGALTVILGSKNFTKDQKASVINAVNNGQDPVAVIKNQAKAIMTGANQTKVESYETAQYALEQLSSDLSQFYANGGQSNLFKGNYNTVTNKLGNVGDPKLTEIATRIQQNLQIYRNAVSGTAYSVQEGNDIAAIFPGINKTEGLNNAIISGRRQAFSDGIDGAYRGVLGSTYDQLKNSKPAIPQGSIRISRNGVEGYITNMMEFNPATDKQL